MDEHLERRLRRRAVRRLQQHERPTVVARMVGRSRQWLNKWWHQFLESHSTQLHSRSRRPRRCPRGYPPRIRQRVVQARRCRQRAHVGLVGPDAVRAQLRGWRLQPLPSRATIGRILHAAGLSHAGRAAVAARAYYPHPRPTATYRLQAMDWTARRLRGGAYVYAFNTIAYGSPAACSRVYGDKRADTVCAYAVRVWQGVLGLPDALQVDNDAAFSGGRRGPRVISHFVRLCLCLGVEPIFIPFYDATRNERVEQFNGLWQRAFWQRRRFRSLREVQQCTPEFEHWYHHVHCRTQRRALPSVPLPPIRLTAAQARALPVRLPITAGRIHFIRLVTSDGCIVILNEAWRVGSRFAGRYVWATLDTARQSLTVYFSRSRQHALRPLKVWGYPMREPVVPLRAEFRRHPRRRKMSTMS